MSTDYRMVIRRKRDNRLLGIVNCNQIKSILNSPLSDEISLTYRADLKGKRLSYGDFVNLTDSCFKRLDALNAKILEKKLMIMGSNNMVSIKKFENEIRDIENEDIPETRYALEASVIIQGMVDAVVEDLYMNPVVLGDNEKEDEKTNIPAYVYNGEDLPKEKVTYSNGKTYESGVTIWNRDVYLELEASY
jgi:hypothetical protein